MSNYFLVRQGKTLVAMEPEPLKVVPLTGAGDERTRRDTKQMSSDLVKHLLSEMQKA